MGTKVQYTSNLSRSFKMRDLNEDAEGSWSQYYEDKASSRNFCNGYQIRPLNGYSEYDKEMLKRTMLEHEAVFRKQVYDLHRLYRTQKNMMAELKNGQHWHLQADTSQSNSFSSQIQSEATASNNRTTPTLTVFNQKTAPSNSNYENKILYCPVSDRKIINLEDDDMADSKNKGVKRKMFDLELPAEVYIDCEEVKRPEKRIVADSSSVTTVPIREDSWKSELRAQNGLIAHGLADLNEPVKEICFEKGASSAVANFQEMKAPLAENQGIGIPLRSHSGFHGLPSVFHEGRHCEEQTSSRYMHVVEEETSWELPFFPSGSGQSNMKLFSPASSKEKFLAPLAHIELNQKPREVLCIDRTKRETWFKPKLDFSGGSPQSGSSSHTFSNYNNISSPLIPSWTNLSNNNSHAQFPDPSLQSFKGTATQRHSDSSNKWEYKVGTYPTSYQNGLNHEVCESRRFQKDMYMNHTFQSGFFDRNPTQKLNELEGKCGDSLGAISWLRKKPSYNALALMQFDFTNGYPQLKPTCNAMNPRYEKREETEKNINLFNLQNMSSSSQTQRNEASEERQIVKKIFGFSIPDQMQSSSAFLTHNVQSETDKVEEKGLSLEIETPVGEQVKCSTTSSRIYINLNSNPNSPDLLTEGEVLESEVPLQACAPTLASGIDVEVLISLETEELDDTLIREAAKCILFISSDKCTQSDSLPCNSVPEVSFNTLHLLAQVVSSNTDNIKRNSDSGLDLFELTTLALEETKPEEFWSRDQHVEDQNDDDDQNCNNFASLLFTKPRGRKRRQKRDFQRDILPGLASLSRKEVTEDLQSIGATRRKSTRGRKPKTVSICVEEIKVDQPLTALPVLEKSPSIGEADVDGKSMLGWGRTTRRCRRQRFPPVTNIAAPLT